MNEQVKKKKKQKKTETKRQTQLYRKGPRIFKKCYHEQANLNLLLPCIHGIKNIMSLLYWLMFKVLLGLRKSWPIIQVLFRTIVLQNQVAHVQIVSIHITEIHARH